MKIWAIIKEPHKVAERQQIENDLETLQALVGGYVETIGLNGRAVGLVNEDGRRLNLPANVYVPGYGVIRGTMVIVGDDGEEFGDVPAIREGVLQPVE